MVSNTVSPAKFLVTLTCLNSLFNGSTLEWTQDCTMMSNGAFIDTKIPQEMFDSYPQNAIIETKTTK